MKHTYLHTFKGILAAVFVCLILTLTSCNNAPEQPATVAGYTNLESLEGHTVAVIAGSTSDVLLGDSTNFANINLIRCQTSAQLIEAVKTDSADCAITDTVIFKALKMSQYGLAVDFNLPGGFDVAAAFNTKDEKLCRQFNDFLVEIKSNGTLDEMFARWCSDQIDTISIPSMPELAKLKGHPIEVATLAGNPPFSFYRDDNWTGLEVEMMLRFSLFIKRPVHFSGYTHDEVLDLIRTNKADIAAAYLFITPDRSNQVLFSHPYYLCKTSCISKAR